MIYDVNSSLFRSFLSQKGGSSDKRYSTVLSTMYMFSRLGYPNDFRFLKIANKFLHLRFCTALLEFVSNLLRAKFSELFSCSRWEITFPGISFIDIYVYEFFLFELIVVVFSFFDLAYCCFFPVITQNLLLVAWD